MSPLLRRASALRRFVGPTRLSWRAFAFCSRRLLVIRVEVPILQLCLQGPLRVERNKVRLRQETQLSDTDIAKASFILLQDRYTGAGNDGIGRCLTTSPTQAWPANRLHLYRMGGGRQDKSIGMKMS